MMYNRLSKFTLDVDKTNYKKPLTELFDNDDLIYSYIVYNKEKVYTVVFHLCDEIKYNTLTSRDVLHNILKCIETVTNKVICYGQPPVDIMLELFSPYLIKLSKYHYSRWKTYFDYEDILQEANLVLLTLYRQGYYINKFLLARSVSNAINMKLRKRRNEAETIYLDDVFNGSDSDKGLTIGDTIEDETQHIEEDYCNECYNKCLYDKVKEIIVVRYGPRTFDQLLSDYGGQHTTSITRRSMQIIKQYFKQRNITKQTIMEGRDVTQ